MIWLPFIAFGLFFGNTNFIYFYGHYVGWPSIIIIMLACLVLGTIMIKRSKLSCLLTLHESINNGIMDEKQFNRAAMLFLGILIAFPGVFSALVGLIIFIPRWRKRVILWLLPLLHL